MELTCPLEIITTLPAKELALLAPALADQILGSASAVDIAKVVLDKDTAKKLLIEKIVSDAGSTLSALLGSNGKTTAAEPVSAKAKQARPMAAKPEAAKRQYTKSVDTAEMQKQVLAFLGKHPGSGRKAICEAVKFRTTDSYNRVMSALARTKQIKSKGDRRNMVYSLSK